MAKAIQEGGGKPGVTLTVNVKVNGLDAAEALIGAHAVIESHRARIAELEAELAATRWQPIETAPKTPQRILVRLKGDWSDGSHPPVVAVRAGPVWMMLMPVIVGGVVRGTSSTLLQGDVLTSWAPLPAELVTPKRQAEPELVVERSEVSP